VSVVRLELTVDDGSAHALAGTLAAEFVNKPSREFRGAQVTVLSDADAARDRTILAAARYFLPEARR
jgi:hypothetical protein